MSASLHSRFSSAVTSAILVLVLTAAPAAGEQMRQLSLQVAAREGTVLEFASAVARQLTPVGVVLLERDAQARPMSRTQADEQEAGRANQDVEAAAAIFEARHPAYRVDRTDRGAVLIAPRTQGWCTSALRSERRTITTTGTAFEALFRVYRAWSGDTSHGDRPGLVGSGRADPSRYQAPVAIQLVDATLEETLNAIVEQVPGLGWIVRETRVQVPTQNGRTVSRLACNLAQFDGSSSGVTTWTLVLPEQ
jgi:hypothetical protein